ncbi:MAG: hypothetical protein ACTTJC_07395 [Campylobacter sp.]
MGHFQFYDTCRGPYCHEIDQIKDMQRITQKLESKNEEMKGKKEESVEISSHYENKIDLENNEIDVGV